VGLEHLTGADFMLSSFDDIPLPEKLVDCKPHKSILHKYCDDGLLIQRKSGGDLLTSISRLDEIIARMLVWSPKPWLVATGYFSCGKWGKVKVESRQTGLAYSALIGALDFWCLRGGGLTVLSSDEQLGPWLDGMIARLGKIKNEPNKLVIHNCYKQSISQIERGSKAAIMGTFMSFPNIGPITVQEIANQFGNLAEAVEWITAEKEKKKIAGVGPTTRENVRKWFGLEDNENLKLEKIKQ
jgi:hypothetical protein